MRRLFGVALYLVRILSPVVARMSVFLFRSMVYALVTVLISFPRAVDFVASDWVDRAIENRWIPTRWERTAYWVFCVAAALQFIAGFIVLSHITVWVFWLIF